jgi:type II secretory pathway pseudopilin PulG
MAVDMRSGRGILIIVLVALLAALLAGAGVYAYQRRAADQALQASNAALQAGSAITSQAVQGSGQPPSTQPTAQPQGGGGSSQGSGSQTKKPPATDKNPPASSATEKQVAFITKITDSGESNFKLTVDYVQLLTGKEAADAYKADGKGELDGDLYLRNQNTLLRTFPLSQDAELFLLGWNGAEGTMKSQVPPDVFQSEVTNTKQYKDAPYTLEIKSGAIVRVEQMYLP